MMLAINPIQEIAEVRADVCGPLPLELIADRVELAFV